MTINDIYTELDELTNNKFSNVSNAKKVRYINRAMLNLFYELKNIATNVYVKSQLVTATNGEISLPVDFYLDDKDLLLYYDENRTRIVTPSSYRVFGNTIRFHSGINDNFYLEYTKIPSRFTNVSDEVEEADNYRALELIQSEVEYIRDVDLRQGQISAQAQAARIRGNEIS